MIIDCVSDLHGYEPELEGGDLLIIAGDLTAHDLRAQYHRFNQWIAKMKCAYGEIIVVAGNHDGQLQKKKAALMNCIYLEDSGYTLPGGMKVWGSPWTPTFYNWHFMKNRGSEIKERWDLIPSDVDILITHGPAFGIQDEAELSSRAISLRCCGCEELRITLGRLTNLKLHVFGHIHESYGVMQVEGIKHVNACIMDEEYRPVNKPIRIEL